MYVHCIFRSSYSCCCCSSAPVPFLLLWMATCAFWMERNVNVSLKRLNKAMNVLSLKQYSPNNYLCATWWWQLASMAMRLSLQCGPSKTDLETLKSNLSLKQESHIIIINLHGICHKGCVEQIAFFWQESHVCVGKATCYTAGVGFCRKAF